VSFPNALAESVIGLYKTECVRPDGPWRGVDDLELATLDWVHWFNETRLHSSIGYVPPTEFEADHYRQINAQQQPLPGEPSLH
jgi:putative transposase